MPPYLAKNKNDRMTSNHFWAAYSPVKKNGERFTLTNFKSTCIINDRHRMHIHHKWQELHQFSHTYFGQFSCWQTKTSCLWPPQTHEESETQKTNTSLEYLQRGFNKCNTNVLYKIIIKTFEVTSFKEVDLGSMPVISEIASAFSSLDKWDAESTRIWKRYKHI